MDETFEKQSSFWSALADTRVMAKRDLLKVRHSPDKLIDVTAMPIILMLLFTELFGGAIAGDTAHYLPIIVPGVIVQTLLNAATATGSQLREDMDTGVFDRFKSLPIARMAPLAGLLLADILRFVMATSFALITGYVLGYHAAAEIGWLLAACSLLIVTAWSISWIFALIGLWIHSTATVSTISMTLAMVLSFVSSAFVPVKTLPKWLQVFANANPVTHMVNAFRLMVNQGQFGSDAWAVLLASVVIVAIFAPLTVKIYSKLA